MKSIPNSVLVLLMALVCISCAGQVQTQEMEGEPTEAMVETTDAIHAKFAPPAGRFLLFVGQDLDAVSGYVTGVHANPSGITTYTNIAEGPGRVLLHGLASTVDYGAGLVNGQASVDDHPHALLAIGLDLVDHTGENLLHIADGIHNEAIDSLGAFIQESQRPVFLRIGYEFDGQWNHYHPKQYIAAFRAIVDRLRSNGVDNFVSVWQSATYTLGTYQNRPIEDWYPGDEYVDWMGTSYFVFDPEVYQRFLEFAREHQKPIMIAEASPQGYELEDLTYGSPFTGGLSLQEKTSEQIWGEWFAPFFDFIYENSDVIRAVAYINNDWNSQPMWEPAANNGYWGDTRIEVNEFIRAKWLEEINQGNWLHANEDLYDLLGFAKEEN